MGCYAVEQCPAVKPYCNTRSCHTPKRASSQGMPQGATARDVKPKGLKPNINLHLQRDAATSCCCRLTSMHACKTNPGAVLNNLSKFAESFVPIALSKQPVVDTSQPPTSIRVSYVLRRFRSATAPHAHTQMSSSNVKQCLPCAKVVQREKGPKLKPRLPTPAALQTPCVSYTAHLPTHPASHTTAADGIAAAPLCCCSALLLHSQLLSKAVQRQAPQMGPSHSGGRSHCVTPEPWLW